MLKRKLEVFGKRLFVTGIVLGLFFAGCAGDPEVTSDAGAVEKEEVVDSKEGDVLQEQEVQEHSKESDISQKTSESQNEEQEPDDQVDSNDTEVDQTGDDLTGLYAEIKESVINKYLEPNGIDPKTFKWPYSEFKDGEFINEDHAWSYLTYISGMYDLYGEYKDEGFDFGTSDQNRQLMKAVLDGIISWSESTGNDWNVVINSTIYPENENIPANVDFSN